MAKLTVNQISELGVELSGALTAAAAGGDSFVNEKPNVFLAVLNTNASTRQVIINPNQTSTSAPGFGIVDKDPIIVDIAQNETKLIGPFAQVFNDINGEVNVTYDDETDVEVGAFELDPLR